MRHSDLSPTIGSYFSLDFVLAYRFFIIAEYEYKYLTIVNVKFLKYVNFENLETFTRQSRCRNF